MLLDILVWLCFVKKFFILAILRVFLRHKKFFVLPSLPIMPNLRFIFYELNIQVNCSAIKTLCLPIMPNLKVYRYFLKNLPCLAFL